MASNEASPSYNRGISPFQGAILHLLLVGIPIRFGVYQIHPVFLKEWVELPSPCSMYENYQGHCSPLEEFAIRDLGYRFVRNYLLSLFACCIISVRGDATSEMALLRFHRTLIVSSFLTILVMSWQQHFAPSAAYEQDFFAFKVLTHLLAVALSVWIIMPVKFESSKTAVMTANWSVPGMAILNGAGVNALIIAASIQAFVEKDGLTRYFVVDQSELSSIARTSAVLSTTHSIVHVMILMRIRDVMTVRQLQVTCLYQLLFNIVLSLLWLPEFSQFMQVNTTLYLGVRVALISTYASGYFFAGKAENVSRIMSGEKSS